MKTRLPPWRADHTRKKFQRQDTITARFVKAVEAVMAKAQAEAWESYRSTGRYVDPDLRALGPITEAYYREVVLAGAKSAEEEAHGHKKHEAPKQKRLMGAPPKPPRDFMKNRRFWASIGKRSTKMSASLRKTYQQKLRREFAQIIPKVTSNDISLAEAKKQVAGAFQATKSRVETVFRTETTNYFASTQIAFFEDDPDIIGFLFDTVNDSSRSLICKTREGMVMKPGTKTLEINSPACHPNCRSHLVALADTERNRRMMAEPGRQPSNRTLAPLPKGWRK